MRLMLEDAFPALLLFIENALVNMLAQERGGLFADRSMLQVCFR